MYLTKKQWTIIAVVAGLVAIYFLFIRKKKIPESYYARIPKPKEFGNKTIRFPNTIESSFDNNVLPLIGSENGYSGALNRSGAGALNRSSNYVPMTKSTTYPKQDPGKGNKWCCAAYGEDGNCKQWVITPIAKKCL
jgi:hypothetical protein